MKEQLLDGTVVSLDDLLGISKLQDVLALILAKLGTQDTTIKQLREQNVASEGLLEKLQEVVSHTQQLESRVTAAEEQARDLQSALQAVDSLQSRQAGVEASLADLQAKEAVAEAQLAELQTKEALAEAVNEELARSSEALRRSSAELSVRVEALEVLRRDVDELSPRWSAELTAATAGLSQRCESAERRLDILEAVSETPASAAALGIPAERAGAEDPLERRELGRRLSTAESALRDVESRLGELSSLVSQGRAERPARGCDALAAAPSAEVPALEFARLQAAEEHLRELSEKVEELARHQASSGKVEESTQPAARGPRHSSAGSLAAKPAAPSQSVERRSSEDKVLESRLKKVEEGLREMATRSPDDGLSAFRQGMEGRLGSVEAALQELRALREADELAHREAVRTVGETSTSQQEAEIRQLEALATLEAELEKAQAALQKDLRSLSEKQAADALRLTREMRELQEQLAALLAKGASATARCLSCFDRRYQQQHSIAVGMDGKVYQQGPSSTGGAAPESWLPEGVPMQANRLPTQGGAGATLRRYRGWTASLEQMNPRLSSPGTVSAPALPTRCRHHVDSLPSSMSPGSISGSPTSP